MHRVTRRDMLKTAAGAGLIALAPAALNGCSSASAGGTSAAALWVPCPPRAVRQMGQIVFGYELYIGRTLSLGLTVSRVEVLLDNANGSVIKTYEGEELSKCLFDKVKPFSAGEAIFTGQDYSVFLAWPAIDASAAIPASLYHRVFFSNGTMAEGGSAAVSTGPTLIGPPMRGDRWVAVNGPSNFDRHHRTAIMTFQTSGMRSPAMPIAQRFGTDWMQLDGDGLMVRGDGTRNTDYYCYNADVLAVADGTVVNVREGVPEGPPGNELPVKITSQNAMGNSIVIDLGDGRFGAYGHLIPGSIRVAVNDKVTKGQVIGKLGNTGNSTGPHLHFHLCNAHDPVFSEGLPFSFASYELMGSVIDEGVWTPSGPPETRTKEMPVLNQVVRLT